MLRASTILVLSGKFSRPGTFCARNMSTDTESSHAAEALQASQIEKREKCIFCKICDGIEPCNIVHQVSDFSEPWIYCKTSYAVLRSLRVNSLLLESLLEKMVLVGKEVLIAQGGSPTAARMGFHWPPFHTVHHLHMHIIAPENEMGFIARGIFKTNSFWFVSPENVIQRLQEKQ
nr:adenosine 5'-monophosphoramidase HINT3-like [Procambarus clarkii]